MALCKLDFYHFFNNKMLIILSEKANFAHSKRAVIVLLSEQKRTL